MNNISRLSVATIFGALGFSFLATLPIAAQMQDLNPSGSWEGTVSLRPSNGQGGTKNYPVRINFTSTGGKLEDKSIIYRMFGSIGQTQIDDNVTVIKPDGSKTFDTLYIELSSDRERQRLECGTPFSVSLKTVSNAQTLKGFTLCSPHDVYTYHWEGETVLRRISKSVSGGKSTSAPVSVQQNNSPPSQGSSSDQSSPGDVIRRAVPKVFDGFFK